VITSGYRNGRRHQILMWPVSVLLAAAFVVSCGNGESSGGGAPIPRPGQGAPPPAQQGQGEGPRSTVPDILVGEWDGGSGPADADYIFTAGGDVGVVYGNRRNEVGTVVVAGSSMTLYLPSGTRSATWSVEELDAGYGYGFLTLHMDGAKYTRQVAGGS